MPRKPKPPDDDRRRYGSGSVVKRPTGRYQAQLYAEDGRRVTRTFDTRRQTEDWLTRTRARKLEGTLELVDARLTTGELLDWWYETYCSMRPASTRVSYHWGIHTLAAPLRPIPAARLRVDQVQRQINQLHQAGRSYSSVMVLVVVLNQAFSRGVADLHLPRVPTVGLRLPQKTWSAAPSWTIEQAAHFLDVAQHDELALFWRLLFATGLRQGELRGLRWEAIDFEVGTLNVWYGLSSDGKTLGLTKNRRRRTLRLDAPLLDALRARRSDVGEPEKGYVFLNGQHTLTGQAIRLRFARLVEAAGLPHLTPHGARHTAASGLREQGADLKDVQEILGHSSVTITAGIYINSPAERQRVTLGRLSAALAKQPASGDQ